MPLITVEITDRVATVTLADPARRNAFNLAMNDEITAAFDEIEAGDVGAVVVTGAPPAFCAGADLSHLGESSRDGLTAIYEGFLRVARCPLPTIAAVNGAAVGAGMNLALATDLRVAARSARFDTRFLQLGIHPGGGHTWMLQRLVGPQTAAAMVLFGEVLSGEAAAAAGLAWSCVDDDALLGEAHRLAAAAAAGPPDLVRTMKATMRDITALDRHDAAVAMELEPQAASTETPAFRERLAAMAAKVRSRSS